MGLIAMYKVKLSEIALKELNNIYEYLAIEKVAIFAADRLIKKIYKKLDSLKHMPASFAIYEPHPDWRIVHVQNYKILYRVDEKQKLVVITRILHSSQNT